MASNQTGIWVQLPLVVPNVAVAELHGQGVIRPVQHRLAVKANEVDVLTLELLLLQEKADRFCMT